MSDVDEDDIPRPKNIYGSLYLRMGAVSKFNFVDFSRVMVIFGSKGPI